MTIGEFIHEMFAQKYMGKRVADQEGRTFTVQHIEVSGAFSELEVSLWDQKPEASPEADFRVLSLGLYEEMPEHRRDGTSAEEQMTKDQ